MAVASTTNHFLSEIIEAVPEGERIRSCLQCGTCSGICPHGFAMVASPRKLIQALRVHEMEEMLQSPSAWLCFSCFACAEACPTKIPLTSGLMSYVKSQLMIRGVVPGELKSALENSRRYGNTLGESPKKRAEWTEGLPFEVPIMARHRQPVEVLWYVGDYASYHPRARETTRAFAKVLNALGVEFGILGPEEVSDGDAQCLAGERGLFELLASKNLTAMGKYEFAEVVTTDPHAFNTMRNEYPHLGADFTVRHYSQFLADRLEELKELMKGSLEARVTYHDPCCLGRANHNEIYEEPRRILQAIPGVELVEMNHNRSTSICCGGGGGGMWLDGFVWEQAGTRTSEWRIKEAVDAGAEVLAIACPFEGPRFEDAAKSTDSSLSLTVRDVAELISDAIEG